MRGNERDRKLIPAASVAAQLGYINRYQPVLLEIPNGLRVYDRNHDRLR